MLSILKLHRARKLRLTGVLSAIALSLAVALAFSVQPAAGAVVDSYGIWDESDSPASPPDSDTSAVELGVKFTTSEDGVITAIRYYKSPTATGSTNGTLWSSTGKILAQAPFTSRTGSGWKVAPLSTSVQVEAGQTYVASYTAPSGLYMGDNGSLGGRTRVNNGSLTALQGVFDYGLGFPTQSWENSNYFADVLFRGSSPTSPVPSSSAPSTTTRPSSTQAPGTTPASTTSSATPPSGSFGTAANTGVPAGVALKSSGSLTISTPGTVVDGLNISGTVAINASNVTLKRSRVTGSAFSIVRVKEGVTGVRIEDVEINGRGTSGTSNSMGVMGPATVVRTEITGVENGLTPSSGSVLTGNFVHNLGAPGSPHYDGIQIDGGQSNVQISANTIDLSEFGQTSAVMIDNYFGSIRSISVSGNRLLGGGYTVYSDGQFSGGTISGVSFTNNRIGKGQWGYALVRNNSVNWSGNVDDSTGKSIASY